MKLYYMPGACSLADHIVLEWIDVPYQATRMHFADIKSEAYLAINPCGNVPLLEHDGLLLTENVAILGYLADLYPQAGLLGDGSPRARAEVMRWLAFLNSDVHYVFKPIFNPARFIEDPALIGILGDNARKHARKYFEQLDAQLEGRDWLTGTRSIADPYLFVVLRWAIAKQVDLSGLGNLSRFQARMEEDVGVRAALGAEEAVAV